MIEYEDFSIRIEPQQGDSYPVIVLRSPAGEGRSSFRLPFDPDKIGDMLFDLGRSVRSNRGDQVREAAPGATRTRPQQIGDQLFRALFAGSARYLFEQSLGMIRERQHGLRIKLHIDPEDASLAKLASLPWELMYRKETRDFLNLSRSTPILRYLDVQRPYLPLPLELPLRILIVISSPVDCQQLDLQKERGQIERTWARHEGVAVDFMEVATITELQDRLAGQHYHVLHYMGHGAFERDSGQGVLMLEDEEGYATSVDGSTLGVLLRDVPRLRLVFLNACETARVTKQEGLDPFAGVAAAMVMAGIPAVVAMQFPITDTAAIRFASRFYSLLAHGNPVDYSVAEGRKAIRLVESGTMEWATPVLFMRAPEGVLFEVSKVPQLNAPLPELPEIDEDLAERLEDLYTAGLSAFWLEEWEKAVRYFQAIVDVQPDHPDAGGKLLEARRRQKLHQLYEQAQTGRAEGDWKQGLSALEALVAEAPDYKDAAALLELARRQTRLAELFAQAQHLHHAGQWQAVINVFAKIATLDPNYPDPDELLPTAKRELADEKRQEHQSDLYSRAVREIDAGRWVAARQLLAQIQAMEPKYRETERLLGRVEEEIAQDEVEQQRRETIAGLYDQARAQANTGQWQQALDKIQEIQALDPEFDDPDGIEVRVQRGVERRERRDGLYDRAKVALEAKDWSGAIVALEELVAEAPLFQDAAAQLRTAKKQAQLANLYDEAERLAEAGQWETVVATFARIATLDPAYVDPQGLLPAAERQVSLESLYSRGLQAMNDGHWAKARQILAHLQELEPSYRSTERLLARANKMAGPTAGEIRLFGGVEMIYVPAGAFFLGPDRHDGEELSGEVPLEGFWIDRTPVTNEQYWHFVQATSHRKPKHWKGGWIPKGKEAHPVVYVSWHDAQAYCRWLSVQAGTHIRLPSEAEWEKAGRGTDGRRYPWGDQFDKDKCNTTEGEIGDTTPVGHYSPDGDSPYGLADMAGNVWEWTSSLHEPYPYNAQDGRENPTAGGQRVVRGGSWHGKWEFARTAYRGRSRPFHTLNVIGFRCACGDSGQ